MWVLTEDATNKIVGWYDSNIVSTMETGNHMHYYDDVELNAYRSLPGQTWLDPKDMSYECCERIEGRLELYYNRKINITSNLTDTISPHYGINDLPADGVSTADFNVFVLNSAQVVDAAFTNTLAVYSETSLADVPSSVSITSGTGSFQITAGSKKGIVKMKIYSEAREARPEYHRIQLR